MIKKLSKHGNGWALVIDEAELDLLKIDPETPLEISTDGETLIITRAASHDRRQRFQAALEKTNDKYGRALKRLAE